MKKEFGGRMQKLAIDAGFTCPNRDGHAGTGGCAYCNNKAFNPSYCSPGKPVKQQLEEGIEFHSKRYKKASSFLAYFQAYSNTYSSVDNLRMLFDQALSDERVKGLVIATRPDCIDKQKLEYLAGLAEKVYVIIEYGIESVYDSTLKYINRGHDFGKSVWALELTQAFGIRSGAHLVFGFPGESREQMMNSAEIISSLPLHSVKFHQLQVMRDTRFEGEYYQNPQKFDLFELDEYVDFISGYIARLNPAFVVDRIASETQPDKTVGLAWNLRYDQVLGKVEQRMEILDVWQGKFYTSPGFNKNETSHDNMFNTHDNDYLASSI
jgi:hypothetical protein